MDETEMSPSETPKRNLISRKRLAKAAEADDDPDLTRSHGQGNGMRVHLIYFAVVAVIALVLVIGGVALATAMM